MKKELWSILNTSGLGLYLIGLAALGSMSILGGLARVDQPVNGVLAQYGDSTEVWFTEAAVGQQSNPPGHVSNEAPWTVHLRQSHEALRQQNTNAAQEAWHRAYLAALSSASWEARLDVGDTSLQIGEAKGRESAKAKARSLYMDALFRARSQGSLDGVLRAGEAFAALGDHEVASQAIRIAERLAAEDKDPYAFSRVRSVSERLTTRFVAENTASSDRF
jgi:hypothetical protein